MVAAGHPPWRVPPQLAGGLPQHLSAPFGLGVGFDGTGTRARPATPFPASCPVRHPPPENRSPENRSPDNRPLDNRHPGSGTSNQAASAPGRDVKSYRTPAGPSATRLAEVEPNARPPYLRE